jgi:two-component system, NarL family, nitrate/nitrite response regulator NarL
VRPLTCLSLVAQNRLLLESLARILRQRSEFNIVYAAPCSSDTVAKIANSHCTVLLIDSSVIEAFGFHLVQEAVQAIVDLKAVMIGMENDEERFMQAVSAGAAGYVLKDASADDVVAAIRAVVRDEVVCPPHLCLSLFKWVARTRLSFPNARVRVQLGLTRREQQLVPLLDLGRTNKEIATQLNLSEQTVKNHIHHMLQKVGAEDRLSLVELVKVNQILTPI